MTKEDMGKYIRQKFSSLGYQSSRNIYYKMFDDDYLIAFELISTGRSKGYYFTCGIIYLPDEHKMPVRGVYDLQWDFIFPWEPCMEFDIDVAIESKQFRRVFEYEKYTLQELDGIFASNYQHFVIPLHNKNYGLDIIRSDWRIMRRFSRQSIDKLCKRAGLDTQAVLSYLGK